MSLRPFAACSMRDFNSGSVTSARAAFGIVRQSANAAIVMVQRTELLFVNQVFS
jgi:hypothetical protein